jgi:hypothetical protein
LDVKWDQERNGIFEPMPFKGDENMLVDAKDRAALDEDEGDNQLLFGFDDNSNAKPSADPAASAGGGGGLLDLDMMLGGPTPTPSAPAMQLGDNMMDLFGGGAPATTTTQ